MTQFAGYVIHVGLLTHAVGALAFLMLSALLVVSWKRGRHGGWFIIACGCTTLWAVFAAYDYAIGGALEPFVGPLEIVRSGSWMAFLISILRKGWMYEQRGRTGAYVIGGVSGLLIAAAFAVVLNAVNGGSASTGEPRLHWLGYDIEYFLSWMISITGLLLLENLYRNTVRDLRWAIKFLCIGIGGLFAYDFFMYTVALWFHARDVSFLDARGAVTAVIVPLLAVAASRNRDLSFEVFVSRTFVFHSASLLGAGIYLLLMAAVGFYLREVGGEWGPVVHVFFLFTAVVILFLFIFSGSFRAWLRLTINKHFFAYKYDYREEWLRLIETMSSVGRGMTLPVRVIQGVADIVESPEGAVWVRQDDCTFALAGYWHAPVIEGLQTASRELIGFFEQRRWICNLDELADDPERYDHLEIPAWLKSSRRPWLVVPLLYHERLFGLLLLDRPRAPKELNWEDYDLLKTVGRQAAHYLSEQQTARTLAESMQFAEFNRRFAFVMHDIKNLVSQLSLLLSNAEKHKNNPAFQEDMLTTVNESVDKLNRMLARLHEGGKDAASMAVVSLRHFVERAAHKYARSKATLTVDMQVEAIAVVADEDRLSAVIAHLLDNAFEAIGDAGQVRIGLRAHGGDAVIEIQDDGPGMDPEFVREDLFRPFKTTKSGGYGIGAYESREYVKELGGRLEIDSRPGSGTVVRIYLPAVDGSVKHTEYEQTAATQ